MGTSRRAVVLQHEAPVHLGNFEPVLRSRGYEIEVVEVRSAGGSLASALDTVADSEPDLVIVLGSEAGVYEQETHDFIAPEIAFVRARLEEQQPILGVCFGAQLIAAALGSEVRRGPVVDVGYRSVTPTPAGLRSPVRHVAGVPVAEWHGDTFDLPEGTTLLASSAAYENEAFGIGDWMLAVQFHPELTAEMHEQWLAAGLDHVTGSGYSPESLRADRARCSPGQQAASHQLLAAYLDALPTAPAAPTTADKVD